MFTAPDSQGTTGERSHNQINQDPFNTEFTKTLTKSSPRFGALSHHSFFSRHNPHPHRVTHIQGLNGRPICMVRDDWCVTSSLFPHPLLKGHVLRKSPGPAFTFPLTQNLHAVSGNNNKSALFSEAWRDELKELVAKVNLSFRAQLGKNEVLELLCQILQTDSLSTVQQWLLLAGQREKDLVMGMLRRALDGVDLSGRRNQRTFQQLQAFHPGASPPAYSPSFDQPWRKPWRTSSYKANPISGDDKPERIGDAEVLEIHAGPQDHPQDPALQST
ncbi:protein TBATA-like isoform X2 [Amphiprion ocellaris]|uniref:protein TBATA-like isoform X2 n=1 Tax=Amphiprion ocellaris TaxID=80972 RepID=UPI001649EA46|nr:protein TBATA-like isoform X2 [Amphiprion ocellaris]XP_054875051.1 protein TBATA-like isoform X2 [Amphiprion ocellaris]